MDNVHVLPPKIDVFGTGITLPSRADVNQAVTGPCWPQLCAVFVRSDTKLSDLHSNTSLETEGESKYLAIRLRSENYETKLSTTMAMKSVCYILGRDVVWSGDSMPTFRRNQVSRRYRSFPTLNLEKRIAPKHRSIIARREHNWKLYFRSIFEKSSSQFISQQLPACLLSKLSLIKHHTVKVREGVQYNSIDSQTRH
jgi:hypothetical protein